MEGPPGLNGTEGPPGPMVRQIYTSGKLNLRKLLLMK